MENMMGDAMENRELKQRWKDETLERKDSIVEFIKNYFENRRTQREGDNEEKKDYDSFVELHFSGANVNVNSKIKTGEAEPKQINVYYEEDEIKQIHILYNSEGKGHNIDVYLKGEAIEDYLQENETETEN
ncbi:MAG: hypothetical protein KAI71_06300 [Candidatus Pacebacteria bacterium]|nr:hypothetical protein [Candidatus Paceibacterota bacterium]